MRIALLYSAGRDSSLAAHLLRALGYRVELVTVNFGLLPSHTVAEKAAESLGFKHSLLRMQIETMEKACKLIVEDGYPRRGIKHLHLQALRELAKSCPAIADGTRRDDLSPRLSRREARSLEDSYGVEYIAPPGRAGV